LCDAALLRAFARTEQRLFGHVALHHAGTAREQHMTLKWIIPVAGLVCLGSATLPAQSAPAGFGTTAIGENAVVQQAHYRHYRHHRYYRYYRDPGVYFYYGHRHHRHWRHW
jgi:hypothetical protein